jgi:hypothetical protein
MSDEDFRDVRSELAGYGVLGGLGAEAQHKVTMARTEDGSGMSATLPCAVCGQPCKIDIGWQEFVYGMNGALPPGWVYNQEHGGMQPHVGCRSCSRALGVVFTPDECARYVKAGVSAGKLNPADVQGMSQQIQQRLGAMRR